MVKRVISSAAPGLAPGAVSSLAPSSLSLFPPLLQNGNTALAIAKRLGYISVVDTLKVVTEEVTTTTTVSKGLTALLEFGFPVTHSPLTPRPVPRSPPLGVNLRGTLRATRECPHGSSQSS